MTGPEEVLQFWFADACDRPEATLARNEFWFAENAEVDKQIWQDFGDAVIDTGNGLYDEWAKTAQGRLALIILLDQFPRNIYRGTAEVFRFDPKAIELASQGVRLGQLAGLSVPEKAFFLMPYQHAEDLDVQRQGVELMQGVVAEAEDGWASLATGYFEFAVRHHDIVQAYGRFPHRNSLLGRSSSEQEERFLADGGETFGQAG
ncbi:MAG: DUF924 family protein [Gammaproteobacteria bacterium]